jgi:toxin ParE1/3/4
MKRTVLRQIAEQDVETAFVYYLQVAGTKTATDFIEAIDTAIHYIADSPGAGSTRYGEWLEVPELRSWLVQRFPYIIIYVDCAQHIDIVRILHQQTDIPARLNEEAM